VSRHERQFGVLQLAVGDVQIGATDTAGVNAQQDFAGAGSGIRDVVGPQGAAGDVQYHGAHRFLRLQPGRGYDKGGPPSQATLSPYSNQESIRR
jgi:hypothetical protein